MRLMRYLLASHNTLVVRGPASVRVLSGEAAVLGAPLGKDEKLVIRREKQLPIEALSDLDLEIFSGGLGNVFEVEESTIPRSWKSAVEALAEMRQGIVTVIGGTDVGKSTLCTYAVNGLLSKGLTLRVIDADIGQADIGPPGTVGSAVPSQHVSSLVDLNPESLIFIGDTSPSRVEAKLISAIRRLVDLDSKHQSLTIINTDGWILDPEAVLYKIQLISAILPDLVIGIGTSTELQSILSVPKARSMIVEAPEKALPRSRSDRRAIRNAGYRRFLNGGAVQTVPLDTVEVRKPTELPSLTTPLKDNLKNLLVGLLNEHGYLLRIGILMNAEHDFLKIFSRSVERSRIVELGYVKLSTDGTELGYVDN